MTVRRYVAAEDCGRVINPMIADGQTHGGVAQGIGAALFEEVIHDQYGQILTANLADYLVPSSCEIPSMDVIHLETEAPGTVGGFRGLGEGGTIGAPGRGGERHRRRAVPAGHRDRRGPGHPRPPVPPCRGRDGIGIGRPPRGSAVRRSPFETPRRASSGRADDGRCSLAGQRRCVRIETFALATIHFAIPDKARSAADPGPMSPPHLHLPWAPDLRGTAACPGWRDWSDRFTRGQ